jgi:hypothetical protein
MRSRTAGIRTWNELGRYVKKGQKGIPILAPMIGTKRQPAEEPAEQIDKPKPMLIGFRVVYVFDVAQTEGTELAAAVFVRPATQLSSAELSS